jgi:hypothetical protein
MKAMYWWAMFLMLLILQIILICVTMTAPWWCEQSQGSRSWTGSLLNVIESDSPYIDTNTYGKVADDVCDLQSRFGACDMFEDLRDAGGLFIFFE